MSRYFNDFLLMLQFLTRIPINKSLCCEKENFRRGALFLPLVGFVVGGVQWLVYYVLNKHLPSFIVSILVLLTAVLITGGLHIDGLGDTCDGFFSLKARERIIEIMKDSRIGTFACIAIVMDLLLKASAYSYVIRYQQALIIVVVPVVSRFMIVFVSLLGKPAKSTGSGNLFIGNMSSAVVAVSGILTLSLSIVFIGVKASLIISSASIITTILINAYSTRKIGGLTGDLLGASNELVEILSLVVFMAINNMV